MKIKNIFKKESKKVVTVQKLEKNQLEKVVGGTESDRQHTDITITKSTNGTV